MKYTKEQIARLVRELKDGDLELTTWEANFLDSLAQQREAGRRLSTRQIEILDRLYAEHAAL